MSTRFVTIVGARPQFIKAAVLSRALKKQSDFNEIIIHTGQHFDANMSDVFLDELEISKPKYALNINGGTHGQMTGRMLELMDDILIQEKPDAVLVYGDTNSTLAGALSASKLHIPVIHIEAGLRSFNKKMPEEINRILTDNVSDLLFCPTTVAVKNLKNEGIEKGVHFVGDVMYDAMLFAHKKIEEDKTFLTKMSYLPEKFIFLTIHRAESTNNQNIFDSMISYAAEFAREHNLKIVYPVHPRVKPLIDSKKLNDNFITIDPISYFETQFCLSRAKYVLTDSGGLQKESYFHKIPCITLRTETEWVETIQYGWNRLWNTPHYMPSQDILEYGNGSSVEKIIEVLRVNL